MPYRRKGRTPPKYKRGTPIRDRVGPQIRDLGYDTSSLQVVRFGGGHVYEVVLEERIVGKYDGQYDKLHLYSTPEECENAPE